MSFEWPAGFERVPDAPWTREPVESLALKYDRVDRHGWYANLDPTVDEILAGLESGDVILDYSGGTGILIGRLLAAAPDLDFGVVNVDSSPKFLRLSLEKFREEPRVAFRLIEYLRDEKRLQYVDEAVGPALASRGVDALVSTNAIHLYHDLPGTLAAWARVVRPGGRILVQSGNIGHRTGEAKRWIIDDTVEAVARAALDIVREDDRFAAYRADLADARRRTRYEELRRRYFVPVRPLEFYLDAFASAGLLVERVAHRPVLAKTEEWYQFLSVYHEGVLGWIGGAEKIEGRPPPEAAVRDRLEVLRRALDRVLEGRGVFEAEWTYVSARRSSASNPPQASGPRNL